ncbi:MAG: MFS transporter [Verrucomicrobiales bacterium]|nr:MFS transporter [Verrucomicrobiales bacterium]
MTPITNETRRAPLDSARKKAFRRLLPLLFLCYVIAYVDRTNVAIAKLTMTRDLPGFDNAVIGFGAGLFFIGYFLLEIPGTLIVERWSARKWICRIMLTWGVMAALTGFVKTPFQFYVVRFFLGLAEAGFFPGIIVYLTHWFPSRDRARALASFMIATPVAQIVSPKISNALLKIGTTETVDGTTIQHPEIWGLEGWQWIYIFWGIPAVILGFIVVFGLTDRPRQARWLSEEERQALEQELEREKQRVQARGRRMGVLEALHHPRVLLLALAYFCIVTGSYGVEFFLPSILHQWYALKFDTLTWLVILPPLLALFGQLLNGWSSDRSGERRLHAVFPIVLGALALALAPATRGNLTLTVICFMLAFVGFKAYLPVFWTLPSLFLTEAAAAGSIGLINSVGNLGGFLGPFILGKVETLTGSFAGGIYFLCVSMSLSATILFLLGLGGKQAKS